jgi:pimeloyl-ACP methyl ester carboxylesterase
MTTGHLRHETYTRSDEVRDTATGPGRSGALKLPELDVLGFSIGGYSAQAFVLRHPHLVRRLMLVGTAPRAQEPRTDPHVDQVVSRPVLGLEEHLFLLFTPSQASQRAGRDFWDRQQAAWEQRRQRGLDIDPPAAPQTAKAQLRGNPRVASGQRRTFRGAQDDQAAHAHRKRLQRYHGPDHQLVDLGSEHSECTTHRLSGLRTRGAFSVSGAISAAQQVFLGRIGWASGRPDSESVSSDQKGSPDQCDTAREDRERERG